MANEVGRQDPYVRALSAVLAGDASRILELRSASHDRLLTAAEALGSHLRFGRSTVLRILKDWRVGKITEEQVRWWALLMFVGAFPQEWSSTGYRLRGPIKEIDIDYSDDDAVNEVVFRLKDLGDAIDGVITPAERDDMVARLEGIE
jgi:hypothetical protein